jgi:zinc D-Ala-D-Ala carboxypeptidase
MINDRWRNITVKHFKESEFDCPCEKGSGEKMDIGFIIKLDKCRELAGIPFKITSGYRCEEYNEKLRQKGLKASKNSSHLKGVAADIAVKNSGDRYKIIQSALRVGFTRIGIGKNFIHLDTDENKSQDVIWHYY